MSDKDLSRIGALTGIRVLDVTDEFAAYASRLLGDLGADVIRIEPPGGSRTRREPPLVAAPNGREVSAFDRFVNAGKRSVTLDIAGADGRALFERLVRTADIVVETWSSTDAERWHLVPAELAIVNPRLIHVSVTPFGRDRPRPAVDDDDLTVLAAGGLLYLGGYPDSAPLAAYGGQSRNAASLFAAVATLVALLERERTGLGRWVDVSAQECVAQALEDSVASYELTGQIRRRHGSEAAEAGTGIYPCADGMVSMVAGRVGTAKAWQALVAWLEEAGADGATALQDPEWSTLAFRQTRAAIDQFEKIFRRFTATRTRLELYRDAQRRGIALSPVNDVAGILADPQLLALGFWVTVPDPEIGRDAIFPGPPYRLSRTRASPARAAPALGADTAAVLGAELGAGVASTRATPRGKHRVTSVGPLDGLRVLDFTWVGAGALATKLLADLGADVIKVESRTRPDNLRLSPPFRPGTVGLEGSGYFASRNSSKRSFALDMREPRAREIALRLAGQVSVVASNFRPGVMERWGLAYDAVRAANPGVIYLTMPMQGSAGPHASFVGFGSTIAALSGLVSLSGLPDRLPIGTGTHFPDHVPNPGHALVATLAALFHRARTGEGQAIEVSQLESTVNIIGPAIVDASLCGLEPPRVGNRAADVSPRGVFPCRGEDRWCAISCRSEAAWRSTAEVLGHPEWVADAQFASLADRKLHEDDLERRIADATRAWDRDELAAALRWRSVPAAGVNNSRDMLEDADLVVRGYWRHVTHPVIGDFTVARPPFRFGGEALPELRRPPTLGEHTAEIARDLLGLSDEEIERLVVDGVMA